MEVKGCRQRWKLNCRELQSKRCSTPEVTERVKIEEGDKEEPYKGVTMAATSKYLTGRQYLTRKPLFSVEEHVSILKKTRPQSKKCSVKNITNPLLIPQRLSPSPIEISLPSTSEEDLGSPLGVSELHHEDSATFGTSFPGNRLAQQSLSRSNFKVCGLDLPPKPRLTSTVLYPTYSPCSNKRSQAQRVIESRRERSWRERKRCSFGVNSKEIPKSPYQADYWACAIPETLPPSPNRHCTAWDPNKEYQELLDYTYPLRPRQVDSEWDSSKSLQDDSLQTNLNLQDSGIAMGHLCSSTSLPGLDISTGARGQSSERIALSSNYMSPDLQFITRSSGEPLSLLSLSSDCLDCSEDGGERNPFVNDSLNDQHHMRSTSTFSAFIRSESVLRQSRCVHGDLDEEFRPLPDQVEELQLLSRQVREMTAQLSWPVTANWDSLETCTTSWPSSISLSGKQEERTKVKELQEDKQDRNDFKNAELLGKLYCMFQVFCSHLELLIQQLNAMSEKMELLTEPTVDVDRGKSSLADYQVKSFQRELSSHQPLASCVLNTGQLLLSCINSTSPFLRDTLLLIESQSEMLQAHNEHFFSSILSAIDSLGQPNQASPVQQSTKCPVMVQEST
uniref:Centrosomal protein 68 n=1 Tax=Pundamilia nyererei TaxID=303518 RepID=A0A3B4FNN7_9CICH